MKKITLILLVLLLLLSAAACDKGGPDADIPSPDTEDTGVPAATPEPVEDPAELCTVTESDSAEIYEETGIYFFAPDTVDDVAYSLIGSGELEDPIAEMSFVTVNFEEEPFSVVYRVHKEEMINADRAGLLFGTLQLESKDSLHISNNVATMRYNEGGEAIVFWHDTDLGYNCCARFADCSDSEALFVYSNLLYAFLHSDITPET